MFNRYLGKYRDVLLGLVLIPVINTINYHLTYSHIRWDWYTAATYAIDTVSGLLSWWIIRAIVLWLDRTMPYEAGIGRRLIAQVLLTNLAVLGFTVLATEGVNALYTDQPLPSGFYSFNLFIFFIWILVINGIYVGMYFHDQWRTAQRLREQDRKRRSSGLQVQRGKQVIQLPFENLGALFVEEGQAYARTLDGERFALDRSLNRLEPHLPEEIFFRVNRRYILNRKVISGFTRKPHGKLALVLNPEFYVPDTPVVSRLTAPSFKSWLQEAVHKA